jgi:hypothetical protein
LAQRRFHQPARDPLKKTYQKLCARAEKTGRKRRASEGPQEYAAALKKIRPDLGAEVERLFQMYISLRYDGQDDTTLVQNFQSAVKRFRPRLRQAPVQP